MVKYVRAERRRTRLNAILAEQPEKKRHSFTDEFYSFAWANSLEMVPGYMFSRKDAAERDMACDRLDSTT